MKGRRLITAMWGCTLLVVLWLASPSVVPAQKQGGTLTVGIETDVRGFDVVEGGVLGASGGTVYLTIADTLILFDDRTGTFQPHLATSWTSSEDKRTWTFKLRDDVRFHDGSPLTADDVVHHMNRILDPKNRARSRAFITPIQRAVAVDAHTVRYELVHPWMSFPGVLTAPSLIGLIPPRKSVEAGTQNRKPIGTGPYRFVSWAGGDRIVVERNPDYWGPRKAHLDRIVFRVLPDPQARYASLQAGDADVIWTDRGQSIRQAENDPSIVVIAKDGKGAAITFLNASKPPLDDLRVRQALAMAWNQEAVLQVTWQGTRPFARHPFGTNSGCDAKYLEHDVAKARQLIADYGKPVTVEMLHTTTPRGREVGEIAQQQFGEIGVSVKLVPVDQNTLVKNVFTNNFMISGWRIVDANDVGAQLFGLTHSKSPYNLSRYMDPELDKVALAFRTAPNREQRDALGCRLIQLVNQSGSMIYRGGNRYFALTRKEVKNVSFRALGVVAVSEAWKE